jgi:hypothetical protein
LPAREGAYYSRTLPGTGGIAVKRQSLQPLGRPAAVRRLLWLLGLGFATLAGAPDTLAQTPAPMDPRLAAQIDALLEEKDSRTPSRSASSTRASCSE